MFANTQKEPTTPTVAWLDVKVFSDEKIEATSHDVGGLEGTKYDLIQMIDLDADGDRDLLACEEVDNLGVIWYENPAR